MGKQINALTTTRAVAAIMVVIYHFGWSVFPFNRFPNFFRSGSMAVNYFFVLSGFVLYTAYQEKTVVYSHYMKKRIARIVPVYLLALFLFICISYLFQSFPFTAFNIKLILVHAFLLQAYIPDYSMNLNIPAWSLSAEMFFYLLFPLLLVVLRKNIKFFFSLTVLLYVSSQVIHLYCFHLRHTLSSKAVDMAVFNPAIHLNQFLIGMFGGYIFGKIDSSDKKWKWVLLFSFVSIVLLMNFMPQSVSCQVGLITPVFMLFILSLSACNPRFLNIRPLVFLGEISYGIYILQLPAMMFFDNLNGRYMHMGKRNFFYFFLCMLILAASISYVFFEKPIREKVNSLRRQRKPVSEVPEAH